MKKFEDAVKKILKPHVKGDIVLEAPPDKKLGDFAFPCFEMAKLEKKKPADIAQKLVEKIRLTKQIKKVEAKGPYVNFYVNKNVLGEDVLVEIQKKKEKFGAVEKEEKKKKKMMVEYCGPNTNKPLHLGHLRNIVLGMSAVRLLESQGNKVYTTNIVNDRGIHISKSMYAYQKWGKNKEPDKKPDHFVGDFYVLFNKKFKENEKFLDGAKDMLRKWEEGDKKTVALWKKMNSWVYEGFKQTYKKMGVKFDKEYYESDIYRYGKNMVMEGLKKGIFKKGDEGEVFVELEDYGLPNKILLRSDGTTIYMTTDIHLANLRFEDFDISKLIYVVASEQDLHFKQLFKILELMKAPAAGKCHHLSYGMVNLPEGKMKSREGAVVDADDLIAELERLAAKEIIKRHEELKDKEVMKRAGKIALGALRFYMARIDPAKDMTYDPEESISFEGETGPYLQYAYARCCSVLRKSPEKEITQVEFKVYKHDKELKLIGLLANYPDTVKDSAKHYKPSILTRYLLDLAQAFSEFYEACQILDEEPMITRARLLLVDCVRIVLKNGLNLLAIDVLEEM